MRPRPWGQTGSVISNHIVKSHSESQRELELILLKANIKWVIGAIKMLDYRQRLFNIINILCDLKKDRLEIPKHA